MIWEFNDGSRELAGFKGSTGDCVTRAIAIASGLPYKKIYNDLTDLAKHHKVNKNDFVAKRMRKAKSGSLHSSSVRNGVHRVVYRKYLKSLGFKWTPTMFIGSGCKVHLKADELPSGKIICKLSRHLVAVVDGVIQDTYDCSRDGTRCVYGYWRKECVEEEQ